MSIAIGLIGTDGIVLATDSRLARLEDGMKYHEDNSQKLWELTNTTGLMSVGCNAGYRHFLIDFYQEVWYPETKKWFQETRKDSNYSPSYIEIVDHFAERISEHIKPFIEDRYHALKLAGGMDFILAGYDAGIPKLFSVDVHNPATPFVPSTSLNNYCVKGVKEIAIHWIQKVNLINLCPKIEFLEKFATMIILETIQSDDMVGGPIQMAVVDSKGYHRLAAFTIDNTIRKYEATDDFQHMYDEINMDKSHQWLSDYLGK